MENMYIYQPTTANMQNQQEQKEKEMPHFHFMLETKESFLDVLARQVMVYDFLGDNAFLNAESNAVDDLHNFCTWQGIPDDSNAYEALLDIIYEYQKICFKAGFETAKQLLK